jgi:hypothetical protein
VVDAFLYCGGANWSLAPYGHENCPLEHLLEIARTHTDSIKQAFYAKRVSRLCLPIIAMPSLSYSLPLGIPLSLPHQAEPTVKSNDQDKKTVVAVVAVVAIGFTVRGAAARWARPGDVNVELLSSISVSGPGRRD